MAVPVLQPVVGPEILHYSLSRGLRQRLSPLHQIELCLGIPVAATIRSVIRFTDAFDIGHSAAILRTLATNSHPAAFEL